MDALDTGLTLLRERLRAAQGAAAEAQIHGVSSNGVESRGTKADELLDRLEHLDNAVEAVRSLLKDYTRAAVRVRMVQHLTPS